MTAEDFKRLCEGVFYLLMGSGFLVFMLGTIGRVRDGLRHFRDFLAFKREELATRKREVAALEENNALCKRKLDAADCDEGEEGEEWKRGGGA